METKVCCNCKKEKGIEFFSKNKIGKIGIHSTRPQGLPPYIIYVHIKKITLAT